ncbi:MAG: polysaccharide pyruvyl transferase family protein [Rhodospirillaceae bacterium]|nr:polysaccharide pyruvyl transferase family protein [Rhodospirillaceae bacterium]
MKTPDRSDSNEPKLPACVVYWRRGQPVANFGDFLTVVLYRRLFEGPPHDPQSRIHLIGSVIAPRHIADSLRVGFQRAMFWGCGMRNPVPLDTENRNRARFGGIRGLLSRDLIGLAPKTTPIGDSALLLPMFYKPRPVPDIAGRAICMPHISSDATDASLLQESGADLVVRSAIAPTQEACEAIIDTIASAGFVLTGSLHGAILAFAYGVPFAYFGGRPIDVPFKWVDFSSSIGFDCEFVQTVEEGKRFHRRNAGRKPALSVDGLLDVAPFPLRSGISRRIIESEAPMPRPIG